MLRAAILLAVLAAAPAQAETRHVSPTGDDAGAGDATHPWRSFTRAASTLKPGDRLVIGPGTYRETLGLSVSGAPGRPIVVEGRGRPRIVGGLRVKRGAGFALAASSFSSVSRGFNKPREMW